MSEKFKTHEEELRSLEIGLKMAADTIEKIKNDKWYSELKEELSIVDKERSDLLHYAEMVSFNASEGYRIAKELKENAIRRREIKNLLEAVTEVRKCLNDHRQSADNSLKNVSKILSTLRKGRQKRKYTLRIRRDLKPIMESKGVKVY